MAYTSTGLLFNDNTELEADVIVFSTGFIGNMKVAIEDILGSEVAERIEDYWGIDTEGEIKGSYRPCGR